MLTSISPVGEAGRGQRWWLTVSAYVVGSTAAGTALGAFAGAVGSAALRAVPASALLVAFGAGAMVALWTDATRRSPPSVRRQVDEQWLRRYRGWVYGLGFGVQLGLGVVTTVVSAAVHLTVLAAVLSRSALVGALIGGVFGLVRALPLVGMLSIRDAARLGRVHRWITRARPRAERLTRAAVAVAGVVTLSGALS